MYHKCLKKSGFSTLMMTLVVLLSVTLLVFMSASSVVTHQREVMQDHTIQQSFNAAQAGLNYGIRFLDKNYSTVTNNQVVTGSLGNGSSYSVEFVFQSGKDVIEIESTGVSADGAVQNKISQWVKYQSGISVNAPPQPLTVRGSVNLQGIARVENYEGDTTILAGGLVDINGAAATYLAGGAMSSNMFVLNSDIQTGDIGISGMDNNEIATTYLGQSVSDLKSASSLTLTEGSTHDYVNELNGLSGQTITINQLSGEAQIDGAPFSNVTIGTPQNPVNLVIDGNLKIHGALLTSKVVIHGNIIVTGDLELRGNVKINGLVLVLGTGGLTMKGLSSIEGGVISGGDATTEITTEGASRIRYNSQILEDTLSKLPGSGGNYSRIAGSWIDNKSEP